MSPESSLIGRFVVIDFAAFQSISLEQMLEGPPIVSDVFECLAEREVDVHHLVGRQTVGVGCQRLERGEIGVVRVKGLQIGTNVMHFREVGPEGQSLVVACQGLVELAQVLQRVAQGVVCLGVVRPESDRLLEACHGLVVLALLPEELAQVVVRLGKIRPESHGLLKPCRCLVELALLSENAAQTLVRLEEVWD